MPKIPNHLIKNANIVVANIFAVPLLHDAQKRPGAVLSLTLHNVDNDVKVCCCSSDEEEQKQRQASLSLTKLCASRTGMNWHQTNRHPLIVTKITVAHIKKTTIREMPPTEFA